jgi:hypothetical protein
MPEPATGEDIFAGMLNIEGIRKYFKSLPLRGKERWKAGVQIIENMWGYSPIVRLALQNLKVSE